MNTKTAVVALAALAQDSRLAIFRLLVQKGPSGLTVGKIGEALSVPPATLSFHLKELAIAKLVRQRQDGRFIHYTANFDAMDGLIGFLSENCCVDSGAADCLSNCAPAAKTRRKAA